MGGAEDDIEKTKSGRAKRPWPYRRPRCARSALCGDDCDPVHRAHIVHQHSDGLRGSVLATVVHMVIFAPSFRRAASHRGGQGWDRAGHWQALTR